MWSNDVISSTKKGIRVNKARASTSVNNDTKLAHKEKTMVECTTTLLYVTSANPSLIDSWKDSHEETFLNYYWSSINGFFLFLQPTDCSVDI